MANDCMQDCTGEWGGDSIVDECGECAGNGYDQCDGDGDGELNIDDWGYGAHDIIVEDIPDDQGGRVLISFHKSFFDTDILRNQEAYTIQRNDNTYWTAVLTLSAYGDTVYYAEATTLQDSSGLTDGLTEFRVISAMEEGNFVNRPDENGIGFSVDNIVPTAPTDLTAYSTMNSDVAQIHMSWDYIPDLDFAYHQTTSMYGEPSYSIYNNNSIELTTVYDEFYVNSVDIHGNYSDPTVDYVGSHYIGDGLELVSFSILPENTSLDYLFPETGVGIEIIGEAFAATNVLNLGEFEYWNWIGSLNHIDPSKGYWLRTSEEMILMTLGDKQVVTEFDLHEGPNLISYTCPNFGSVQELIANDCIEAILGKGVATYFIEGIGWVGSISVLESGKGYWFSSNCNTTLSYDCPENDQDLTRISSSTTSKEEYIQSTEQAFYFINEIDNIEIGDKIEAYNDITLVGSRIWNGAYTDIPVMGIDNNTMTDNYCDNNSTPNFKLIKTNGEVYKLSGEIPQWKTNGIFIIPSMTTEQVLPEDYTLLPAYPNPFNPTTSIELAIPLDGFVSVKVYNLKGQVAATLHEGMLTANRYNFTWDAINMASGMYFLKVEAVGNVDVQKIMLMK